MNRTGRKGDTERILISLGALAAGTALGLLYISPKGRNARRMVAGEASRRVKWLDRHLDEARERILAAGDEAAEHLRSVGEETVEKVIPDFGTEDAWNDVYSQTEEDLRRSKQ
ncbi:MAG TPA: hypothetical protein VMO47_11525 [Rhodothermales bacterium]|nr:hypothetical protein [Rhodothermales bacterium]